MSGFRQMAWQQKLVLFPTVYWEGFREKKNEETGKF